MKIDTGDALPLGLKFTWICSRCEGEDFEQVDNTTFKCLSCGRFFTMDVLMDENRKREKEYLEEFREAFRAALKRRLEERKKDK